MTTATGGTTPPGGPQYTQSQMANAIKAAGLDASTAHIFGAIGMGETSGWDFPTINSTGEYHGPWAFQRAWTDPAGIDRDKLDTDLNYAAQQVVKLYKSSGWHPWYGDAPGSGGNYLRFMGNADSTSDVVNNTGTTGISRDEIVAFAKQQIGKPYVWGAHGPSSFDCQGLVSYVFNHFGVALPGGATAQIAYVPNIEEKDALPGDVVGFHADDNSGFLYHHIGIVSGNGKMVNALDSNSGVVESTIADVNSGSGAYVTYGRPKGLSDSSSGSTDTSITSSAGDFFSFISDPTNWIRLGFFVAGLFVLAPGVWKLATETDVGRHINNGIRQAGKEVGKVAATGAAVAA